VTVLLKLRNITKKPSPSPEFHLSRAERQSLRFANAAVIRQSAVAKSVEVQGKNSVRQRVSFTCKIIKIIVNGGTVAASAAGRRAPRFNGPARSRWNAGLNSLSDHREITDRVGIGVRRA